MYFQFQLALVFAFTRSYGSQREGEFVVSQRESKKIMEAGEVY
jgi:hypothetical protein